MGTILPMKNWVFFSPFTVRMCCKMDEKFLCVSFTQINMLSILAFVDRVCALSVVFFFPDDFILAQTCLLNLKRICSLRYDFEHCIWIVWIPNDWIYGGEDKSYISNGNGLNAQNGIYKEEYLRLTYKLKKKSFIEKCNDFIGMLVYFILQTQGFIF